MTTLLRHLGGQSIALNPRKACSLNRLDWFRIQPDSVVTIPVDLKLPVLNYLRKYHRISIEVIYNDMHGFIRRNAYMEFLRGATYRDKAEKAKTRKKKDKHCEKAIRHYTEALKLKPNLWFVYNNRGNAYADRKATSTRLSKTITKPLK